MRNRSAVAALALAALPLAACAAQTVQTTGSAGSGDAKLAKSATARVGSSITLAGNSSGEQMSVTVVKVINDGQGTDYTQAPAGDRLYAVQFRLRDTGSAGYSDSPSNGAEVTDSQGQSYESAMADTVSGCVAFPASVNIAPGGTGLGCIVFEVPRAARITGVQFTLDSGMGSQTGQWKVG
jgi:Domain of unknown function (DUF4352)